MHSSSKSDAYEGTFPAVPRIEQSDSSSVGERKEGRSLLGRKDRRERTGRGNGEHRERNGGFGRTKETDGTQEATMKKRNGRVIAREGERENAAGT